LSIVYCLLSIVYCLLSIVYCLLSIVYCQLGAVGQEDRYSMLEEMTTKIYILC